MQEPKEKPKAKNVMRGKVNTKPSMAPAESYGDFTKSAKPVNRPDTPLAMSPEPYGDFRKSKSVMRAKINTDNGKVSVNGVDIKNIKSVKK